MLKTITELLANPAHFKNELVRERFKFLHPRSQDIALAAFNHALSIGVDHPVFTETVTTAEEDKLVDREHDQHRRKIAWDLRVFDYSGEQIDSMLNFLNTTYAKYAYLTKSGERHVAIYHKTKYGALHFHCAINAVYKLKEFKL